VVLEGGQAAEEKRSVQKGATKGCHFKRLKGKPAAHWEGIAGWNLDYWTGIVNRKIFGTICSPKGVRVNPAEVIFKPKLDGAERIMRLDSFTQCSEEFLAHVLLGGEIKTEDVMEGHSILRWSLSHWVGLRAG